MSTEESKFPDESQHTKESVSKNVDSINTPQENPATQTQRQCVLMKCLSDATQCAFIQDKLPLCKDLMYWNNPVLSGITLLASLAFIVSFKIWSCLSVISLWILFLLSAVLIYNVAVYVFVNILGSDMKNVLSDYSHDWTFTEKHAECFSHALLTHGNDLLRLCREIFLWENFAHSFIAVAFCLVAFYIGKTVNTLNLLLISVIVFFTVPKVCHMYKKEIRKFWETLRSRACSTCKAVTSRIPGLGHLKRTEEKKLS